MPSDRGTLAGLRHALMRELWRWEPRKGDRYTAMGCIATVRRVSVMRWADIHVRQISTGAEWTKRQPLPLPADWTKLEESDGQ